MVSSVTPLSSPLLCATFSPARLIACSHEQAASSISRRRDCASPAAKATPPRHRSRLSRVLSAPCARHSQCSLSAFVTTPSVLPSRTACAGRVCHQKPGSNACYTAAKTRRLRRTSTSGVMTRRRRRQCRDKAAAGQPARNLAPTFPVSLISHQSSDECAQPTRMESRRELQDWQLSDGVMPSAESPHEGAARTVH